MIEAVITLFGGEVLNHRQPLREGNVARHLAAQRAMADWLQPGLERLEDLLLAEIRKLLAKALEITEGVLVDEAHEAEELQEGVLEGCSSQKELGCVGERPFERVGDDVCWLVHVAEPVGFVDHHQVPLGIGDVRSLAAGEMVGADDDLGRFEGAEVSLPDRGVVRLGFENPAGQEELLGDLLEPLLAQV